MAIGVQSKLVAILASLAAALTFIAAAGPAASDANGASPCKRWGNTHPDELSHPQARKAVLCLVNKERAQRGLKKLDRDRDLQKAAQKHTDWMVEKNCFDHECPGEKTLQQRLGVVGYLLGSLVRWAYGENIAYGGGDRGTPKKMVKGWMNSSGHRANILNRDFRDFGVGFRQGVPGGPRASGGIYTTDFGLAIHG